ncbi:MAG: FAD-binding protein [Chitinophagaceae bacterium]
MLIKPLIKPTNLKAWPNRHNTLTQKLDNLLEMRNGDSGNVLNDYNAMTKQIQDLIGKAIKANMRIRALGGGWSFTKVAATEGWLLDTKQLNMVFNVSKASVSNAYKGKPENLVFAQCGNSVKELNDFLKSKKKALKTSGASNGQTIVGAFSTGTHGSAIDFGATPDFVAGLHIIVSPGRHVYLERASNPVVSDAFVAKFQTELIRDDELFNAALVSFGSFGFIHGVMVETEDLYLLECYRQRILLDASLKKVMQTLDFTGVKFLPFKEERPFHFQVVVNQYDLEGGAYVTIMYKRPYTEDYKPPVENTEKAGPGDDLPTFIGKLTELVPLVTHLIVNTLVKLSYSLFDKQLGTLGEIFYNSDTRGKVLSTALGIPISFVNQVNDLLVELNKKQGPYAGIFSYRYVKKTDALLGFTKFDHTCILELDGVDSAPTKNFYDVVWKELDARNIPYSFHWGKINNLNTTKVIKIYGANRDKWLAARNKLLPPTSMTVFSNQIMKDMGLDKTV